MMDFNDIGGDIELAPGVYAPVDAVRVQYARGGGPGGQNVNKVNTKAELWVDPSKIRGLTYGALGRLAALAGSRMTLSGEIHFSSDVHRTQTANREEVFSRLREMILLARVEPKRRRKTKPTRASRQRRLDAKKRRGEIKSQRRAGDGA